ncbi:hypothetical protein BGW80DRAFT_1304923 [Lactifluus volemus]|nr:hypothetical protein BGW80DRAFT_1304923 [Lactifluus volemus]
MFRDDDDAIFQSLASNIRSRIDNAFYSSSLTKHPSAKDVPKVDLEYDVAPGGFLLDDDDDMAGGFLPPSPPAVVQESGHEPEGGERPSYISLSRIPYALQLLDLPPDDEEVLAVFRSAATGWGDDYPSSRRTGRGHRREAMITSEEDPVEEHVSLRDWRAVCAALMDEGGDNEAEKEGSTIDDDDHDRDEEDADADATGQDMSSGLEDSSGETSDEYRSETRSRKRPRKSSASAAGPKSTRKAPPRHTRSASAARRCSPLSPSASAEITPRQQRECLQTFLLFFPGVPEEVAKRRRLGVRELNAAATMLNEKIKTEEMVEMVEAFSSSPDKTMSLADFEKMMIATRLA